jgi:hypothetical protein
MTTTIVIIATVFFGFRRFEKEFLDQKDQCQS